MQNFAIIFVFWQELLKSSDNINFFLLAKADDCLILQRNQRERLCLIHKKSCKECKASCFFWTQTKGTRLLLSAKKTRWLQNSFNNSDRNSKGTISSIKLECKQMPSQQFFLTQKRGIQLLHSAEADGCGSITRILIGIPREGVCLLY